MTFFQAFCCNPIGCHSQLSFSGVIEDGQERKRGKQQKRRMGQSLSDGRFLVIKDLLQNHLYYR
jgi:hypothetical protein